jgi:hypothetical protein
VKKFKIIVLALFVMFAFTTSNVFANSVNDVTTNTGLINDGQGQGQGQGQSIDSHDTNISERALPNQGGYNLPGMPGFFGDNNKPGHQFISLDKLMMYNTAWNIKAKYPVTTGQKFNVTPHAEKVAKDDRTKVVVCTKNKFDTNVYEVKLLAVGAVNSTNKNTISSDLLDKVLSEASQFGATHIQFLAEGTNTELSSSGWGIGLAYTKAGETGIGTGGTGFTTGWAGYNNLPWQQFFFLKVVDPAAVAALEAAAAEEAAALESSEVVDENVDKAIKDVSAQ